MHQDGDDEPGSRVMTTESGCTAVAEKTQRAKAGKDAPAKAENDVQKRMREALEAKQAKNRAAHGEDHLGGHNVGPATNDKHQRQFRRKSG